MIPTVWIISSLVIGYWNRHRGNSFWLGFLYSFFLTPVVGFFVVLWLKKNRVGKEERRIKSDGLKKCPSCAELVRAEAVKCRFCGEEFA